MSESAWVVWKFPVSVADFSIELPEGSEVLTVQIQHGAPQMWVRCQADTNVPKETRRFRTIGTGHVSSLKGWYYVGTFQLGGGQLVFHLFEYGNAKQRAIDIP